MRGGLLGIEGLDRAEIDAILHRARDFQTSPNEAVGRPLHDRLIVNLFFEASSGTRNSFETAARRLGAEAVSITSAASSGSTGGVLADTRKAFAAMRPHAVVLRHPASGAPHFLARHIDTPIINAGDGAHEHPTQALVNARTLLDRHPTLEGLRVAIVGDIANSRVARSNVHLLAKFGAAIVLCGPPSLLPAGLADLAPGVRLTNDLAQAVRDADIIMMLRVPLDWKHETPMSADEYFQFYGLRLEHLQLSKPDVLVIHPGPVSGRELSAEVAGIERSVILNQAENAVAVRMAVLEWVLQ